MRAEFATIECMPTCIRKAEKCDDAMTRTKDYKLSDFSQSV